jgi:acetoin utilization protein AcuB
MPRAADSRWGTVRDWMTREPETVTVDCAISLAVQRMQRREIRHLLVVDGARLVGVVSNRDLRRLLTGDTPGSMGDPVSRIMTEDPVTVSPDVPVAEAARLLLEQKIGALPVREGDVVVGIFTTSDALDALLSVAERPAP